MRNILYGGHNLGYSRLTCDTPCVYKLVYNDLQIII